MENINKNDFIDVYIIKTLSEIKQKVKWEINLDEKREKETDEKMFLVLRDLINANFKNLQLDTKGNLIYTLLPIVDERENEKVRLSLVLYYAALYYDNVDLLHDLLKGNIEFRVNSSIRFEYLDKSVSSKFKRDDYVRYIKNNGDIFCSFIKSIKNVDFNKREEFIKRFVKLFNENYEHISNYLRDHGCYSNLSNLFDRGNLVNLDDESYRLASDKQLGCINSLSGFELNESDRKRLNNLIQNTDFAGRFYDIEFMMELFSDEELMTLSYDASYFLSKYSKNEKMLNKALDFLKLRPDLCYKGVLISENRFMEIDNCLLIEVFDQMEKKCLFVNDRNLDILTKTMVPKSGIKKLLGLYKRNF